MSPQLARTHRCQLVSHDAVSSHIAWCRGLNGTLFRLPLRSSQQAADSRISQVHYTHQQMLELLGEFCDGAAEMLLFLRHIEVSVSCLL